MDWLKEASKVAASDGLPVYWTNPAGLPIVQAYKEALGTKINLYFDGKRRTFTISNDGERLDSRKQAAGIAPNFVHSCDSGHMMRTLVKCKEVGLTHFSFIHDSFGTHAGDMGDLSYILREAFVEQYSQDILGAFRKELVEQLSGTGSTNLVDKLPPVPPFGSLDLSLVVESNYFFA
jgi:DNA-directed RNA polymerase